MVAILPDKGLSVWKDLLCITSVGLSAVPQLEREIQHTAGMASFGDHVIEDRSQTTLD